MSHGTECTLCLGIINGICDVVQAVPTSPQLCNKQHTMPLGPPHLPRPSSSYLSTLVSQGSGQ